ncbi:hypothetical protein BN946_scf185043.g10 [Trametes cinnabarina]|uniref:Uncharacterized protein n=1 Tax=Pycnoporus cinnabarinus TaxID=5643 RepID=A0A060SHH3_PYCCI|nr:hypothetical protein BN946_scf185043.g10 [Trametes cinnabarina]
MGPATVKLRLPSTWKIHPVFHTSLISHYCTIPEHGPNYVTPPPDVINGEEEWEIESIINHRKPARGGIHLPSIDDIDPFLDHASLSSLPPQPSPQPSVSEPCPQQTQPLISDQQLLDQLIPDLSAILDQSQYHMTTFLAYRPYDGPGRVDCLPGALRHHEEQAWDNLISTHAPLTSPNTANQQWGLPSGNSTHWGVSPTPWDGSDNKVSNGDSDKENGRPNTPHPQVQAPPTTPTPSLPELQEDDEDDDSISEEARQYLRNFLFGLTRNTPFTTLTNALDVLATVASAECGIPTTPYLDDVIMTVNPNDLRLPMGGQV